MKSPLPLSIRIYCLATSALRPFAGALLGWRQQRGKEEGERQPERFGIASQPRPEGPLCWLHGASVGEAVTLLPLIKKLSASGYRILMTTGTVTSASLMAKRLPPGAIHQYVPLDVPAYVGRFLEHWQPDMAIFIESEIWPSTIIRIRQAGVRLALVNARMSERSFRRWRRAPRIIGTLLRCFNLIIAQSQADGERLMALGADNVLAATNLKFDAPPLPADVTSLAGLRAMIAGRPVWVAASTHSGEEVLAGQVHCRLKQRFQGLLTVVVPRHPNRAETIARELGALGLVVHRRSSYALPAPDTDIYLVDTVGELGLFYRLSTVVFIGKSLVGRGGQNPVEPAKLGCAVICGPFVHNFAEAFAAFRQVEGVVTVNSGVELAEAVGRLLADSGEAERIAHNGLRAVSSLSGSLERTFEALCKLGEAEKIQ